MSWERGRDAHSVVLREAPAEMQTHALCAFKHSWRSRPARLVLTGFDWPYSGEQEAALGDGGEAGQLPLLGIPEPSDRRPWHPRLATLGPRGSRDGIRRGWRVHSKTAVERNLSNQ